MSLKITSLAFEEEYFTTDEKGMKNYKEFPHFKDRAIYIRDTLNPIKGVIIFGGAFGYTNKYLDEFEINNINHDTSIYCYNNKVCQNFETDITKVQWDDYDWLISWNVLDCLNNTNVDAICNTLNGFNGNQLHILCCDGHTDSQKYKEQGYFIKSHEYWKEKLPTANLVCWDGKKTIQGTVSKVPLRAGKVSD